MKNNRVKSSMNKGYIALVSALIISAILLIITFSVSFANFFARFNILDSEFKKISTGLAEACAETAILELNRDFDWQTDTGGTPVTIGSSDRVCKICPIESSGGNRILHTRSIYKNAVTNLRIELSQNASEITIDSWTETPNYLGAPCGP